MLIRRYLYLAAALTVGALILAQSVRAQDASEAIDVVRGAIDEHADTGGIDTILVFTNLRRGAEKVAMTAVDEEGHRAGSGELEVPSNGVAAVLLSRLLSDTTDHRFVGKVLAKASGHVAGTALLIGGGPLTDLPVLSHTVRVRVSSDPQQPPRLRRATELIFPVTASN